MPQSCYSDASSVALWNYWVQLCKIIAITSNVLLHNLQVDSCCFQSAAQLLEAFPAMTVAHKHLRICGVEFS